MRNLWERLPPSSQVNWDITETPQEARSWDTNTYMLANVIDAIMALDWHFIAANSKRPPKPPKPFARPQQKKKQPLPKKRVWAGKTIVDKGKNNGTS